MPKTSSGEKAKFRAPSPPESRPNNDTITDSGSTHTQPRPPSPQDLPPSYDVINPPIPSISITPTSAVSSNDIPSFLARSQNPLDAISRLASVDLTRYCGVSQAKLSASQDTLTTTKPELSTMQYVLMRFLNEQASLPPKPLMRIQGSHTTSTGTTQIDFDLTLNLMSLLDIDHRVSADDTGGSNTTATAATAPSTRLHVEPFESSTPTGSSSPFKRSSRGNQPAMTPLEQWAKKFTDEKTENKSFSLHRQIANFPAAILEGMVRTLLAATRYRGKVTVEFPVQFAKVVVQRESGNWFANMLRLYPTKKYEVVQTVWDVASTGNPGPGPGTGPGDIAGTNSTTTTAAAAAATSSTQKHQQHHQMDRAGLVAQEWWREWQYAIWNAVIKRRTGWVTIEDWIEAKMGVKLPQPSREWGVESW
ncbi:hypothetical protein PV08_00808 [Exophiala spinifera]|uniref:Uncharacterized protein n=1 Tax=Exophiala spinifera TaxID=91928 RepID=A0A0D2BMR2_9EURO|nr:uncharacterized protein PV08_00808 [Exophiala spinifera]KIW20233.1 hypothetical protein PV08_00808 [Exophiala spinifera]